MIKLTEQDIRLGISILTPDGEGVIENADRRKETVGVAVNHDIRNLKTFKISELSLLPGNFPPNVTQEIGEIAIVFSRIEDRLQDFLNYVFGFKNTKQRILLIKGLTVMRSLEMINEIIKDCYFAKSSIYIKWSSIFKELKSLNEIRNNIIHGSLFFIHEKCVFSNSKKINKIVINSDTQVFDFEELSAFSERLYKAYYQNMSFLNEICQNVKTHLNKQD
jgi:hypothetical protein